MILEVRELKGPAISLRSLDPDSISDKYLEWMNDSEVMQFIESRFMVHTREDLSCYLREMNASPDNLMLGMFRDERHVGNIKLGPINPAHRFADIGLILGDKAMWGKGIGADAIALISEYAFQRLKLHKITAGCYAPNTGSLKAFQKAGYAIEGRLCSHYLCGETYVDKLLLGKINPDEAAKE